MIRKLILIGGIGLAAVALPAPAAACGHSSCTGSTGNVESSTGGQPVPAPAGLALFALAATLIVTRRRKA
jgi:hypothetical protein